MLLRSANPYIVSYRTAKQCIEEDESCTFGFCILDPQLHDPRRYNRPTASEVAVIMEGDGTELHQGHDIIIQTHGNRLQRVSELHSSFLPLRFPLLCPQGEPGWHPNIPFSTSNSAGNAFHKINDTICCTCLWHQCALSVISNCIHMLTVVPVKQFNIYIHNHLV